MYPEGRIGTARFLAITGLSRTRFFTAYRQSPRWIRTFDIRIDRSDRLSFDEEAARAFAANNVGRPARGRTKLSDRLKRTCTCGERVSRRARFCPACGDKLEGQSDG